MSALGLDVVDLTVRFGGLVAVRNVSLEVPRGRLTGLIGPNGAGKSTTFNACSGLNRPTHGTILLDSHDVSSLSAAARAQRGLGRTFQKMELYDRLTVAENVALGYETLVAGSRPLRLFWQSRVERQAIAERTGEAIERCWLASLRDSLAGTLSTGQRRMVELARALAGDYSILLLDEPSSGLDPAETARFAEVVTTVVAERGIGILLVEHDMSLVHEICSYTYVLDFGQLIAEGETGEVLRSDAVRAAYLGSEVVA